MVRQRGAAWNASWKSADLLRSDSRGRAFLSYDRWDAGLERRVAQGACFWLAIAAGQVKVRPSAALSPGFRGALGVSEAILNGAKAANSVRCAANLIASSDSPHDSPVQTSRLQPRWSDLMK